MKDKFWFEDPTILFNNNRLLHFVPNINMDFNEKLNSISRFSIYLTLLIYIYIVEIIIIYIYQLLFYY
jgi:hypothetical protein